jgi:hypothetical protein
MLPGEAPIARSFLSDMQLSAGLQYAIELYRTNDREAFVDNQTIRKVNENNRKRGAKQFVLRREPTPEADMEDTTESAFRAAAEMAQEVVAESFANGRVIRVLYSALYNNPPCQQCHGTDHIVRGVIKITADRTEDVLSLRRALALTAGFFVVLVPILAAVMSLFLRRSVIRPVREIGQLGRTVNQMAEGLYERFQLSKFVSGSTLASIHGGAQSRGEDVTMLFMDIRGFTAYSEKTPPEVVVRYLNRILSIHSDVHQ